MKYELTDSEISFSPFLFNRKEWFKVKLLVRDYEGSLEPSYRIKGITDLINQEPRKKRIRLFSVIALIFSIALITIGLLFSTFIGELTLALGTGLLVGILSEVLSSYFSNVILKKKKHSKKNVRK